MPNYEDAKWGSATLGTAAVVTWSFGDLTQLVPPGRSGYQAFDSTITGNYRNLVQQAMDAWEAVANIDLVLVNDSASSNIRVGNLYIDGSQPNQASTVGETSFWAQNGVLSTAEIYFDTDAYAGSNFYQIAVHEIGHALGLDHSNVASAVMYYMVNNQNRTGALSADDIAGIQHLYGAKPTFTVSYLSTLQTAFGNILRIDPTSTKATGAMIFVDGASVANPTFTQAQGLSILADQVDAGGMTLAQAIAAIGHYADATTSVATLSYQFFTGKTPTAAGLDYLVNSTANPNDLNDAYYAKFNLENRYINFAANLGKLGEGKAAFQAKYGALTLADTVKTAYAEIFGAPASDQKVADILNAQFVIGGQAVTRAAYLASFGLDGPNGQGTKAAAVGFLLAEAVKADIGPYAAANDKFLADLADGGASFNTNLKVTYADMVGPDLEAHTDGVVAIIGSVEFHSGVDV
jgi:hypothetical protein